MLAKLPTLVLAVLLMTGAAAPAAPAAALNDVLRALERPFQTATPAGARINDYRADFAQEARIASLDRVQRARGRVSVRFDHRRAGQEPVVQFHWQYTEPSPQQLISDGKTLWVYLPENNQVIISKLDPATTPRENDPMAFLTGLGNLTRDFEVSFAAPERDNQGNYRLELRPRLPSALLERMVITVTRTAVESPRSGAVFPIQSTTVYDQHGNSTSIEFAAVRVNQGLPQGEFSFTPPAGVEVVRPGGVFNHTNP